MATHRAILTAGADRYTICADVRSPRCPRAFVDALRLRDRSVEAPGRGDPVARRLSKEVLQATICVNAIDVFAPQFMPEHPTPPYSPQ